MELKIKPNGIFYLDVRLPDADGTLRRKRVSLDTRDKHDAETQRRQWLAGTHPKHPAMGGVIEPKGRSSSQPRGPARAEGLTLQKWLWDCLDTIWNPDRTKIKDDRTHRSNVRVLSKHIPADLLLSEVSKHDLSTLADSLWEAGYKPASVRKLLTTVSRALTHATEVETKDRQPLLAAKPATPTISVNNRKERVITRDEEEALHQCIDARIHAEPLRHWQNLKMLFYVLSDTGMRMGEALRLGPSSVNRVSWLDQLTGEQREGIFLLLQGSTTKNSKPRQVPLTDRLLSLLPQLNAQAKGGRWFVWAVGSSGPGYLLANLREDMKAKGFDIDDVTLHTWRHTCATRLAQGGMDLIGLRDWLGHSNIKVTADRYVHHMVGHIHRGTAILDIMNGTKGAGVLKQVADDLDCSLQDDRSNGTYRASASQ